MKICGEAICHFIILTTIIEMSLEECTSANTFSFRRTSWHGRSGFIPPPFDRTAYCTDLSELHIEDDVKPKITVIEINNDGATDEIRSGLFKGFNNTVRLNITNDNVRYIEPGAFDGLPNLEYIDLSDNKIFGLEEGTLEDLSKLKVIDISRNKISCLHSDFLGSSYPEKSCTPINCESLEMLNLSDNELTGLELSNCTCLKELQLGGNNIDGQTLSSMKVNDLYALENLNLARNKLTCVRVADDEDVSNTSCPLINCGSLLSLDLSDNRLENVEFVNCSRLNEFLLSGNRIKELKIDGNPRITLLDLTDNKLDYITSEYFSNFTSLQSLNLSRNALFAKNDMPPNLFSGVRILRALNLSSTSMKRIIFGTFTLLPYIETLDLSFNELTYIPRHLLGKAYTLRRLYLNSNQLTTFDADQSMILAIDLNDNFLKCSTLLEINRHYGITLIKGTTYNATNFNGIKCEADDRNQTKVNEDLVALEKEYLSFLARGQDDLKEKIVDLNRFLNESSIHQKNHSRNSMKTLEDTLLAKDAILYGICLIGFVTLVAFLTFYYRYLRKNLAEDRILTTFHVST